MKLINKLQYYSNFVITKPQVILEIETNCFFKCKHCDIWKNKNKKHSLSEKNLKKVIDKLYKWMGPFYLSLEGGEPFSNPLIFSTIEYAKKKNKDIYIDTNSNGFLINEVMAQKIIDSGINAISFSLDHSKQEEHNYSRGNSLAYQRVTKAIKTLDKLRNKNNSNIKIYINTVIMKQNLKYLPDLVKFTKKHADAITLQALWENVAAPKHNPNWFKTSEFWPDDEKKYTKSLNKIIKMKESGYPIANTTHQLNEYAEYFKNPKQYWRRAPCTTGIGNFSIDENGSVRLCFSFESIGNVVKEDPKKIWFGKKAREQRQKIKKCKRGCRILLCMPEK